MIRCPNGPGGRGQPDEREAGLAAALDQIRGVDIDEAAVRAHVMWPDHLLGVTSDRGREGAPLKRFFWPPAPVLYRFDASGFIRALEEQLTENGLPLPPPRRPEGARGAHVAGSAKPSPSFRARLIPMSPAGGVPVEAEDPCKLVLLGVWCDRRVNHEKRETQPSG